MVVAPGERHLAIELEQAGERRLAAAVLGVDRMPGWGEPDSFLVWLATSGAVEAGRAGLKGHRYAVAVSVSAVFAE